MARRRHAVNDPLRRNTRWLKPFVPGPTNGTDTPEPGITRSWSIAPAGATIAPNRLALIQVVVRVDRGAASLGAKNVTLTTMRAA